MNNNLGINYSTLITSAIAACLFIFVFYFADAETYLFPRIIATAIIVLSVLLWFDKNPNTYKKIANQALLPGLGAIALYVLTLDWMGFYLNSFMIFLIIISIYKTDKFTDFWRDMAFKFAISLFFMIVLYLLFWQMLNVRTPIGLMF